MEIDREWVSCQIDKDGNVIEESVGSSSSSSNFSTHSSERPAKKPRIEE